MTSRQPVIGTLRLPFAATYATKLYFSPNSDKPQACTGFGKISARSGERRGSALAPGPVWLWPPRLSGTVSGWPRLAAHSAHPSHPSATREPPIPMARTRIAGRVSLCRSTECGWSLKYPLSPDDGCFPLPNPGLSLHVRFITPCCHGAVQVLATSLNPVDYKIAELPLVGRFAVKRPATPGL
jgi:hypothetical protein